MCHDDDSRPPSPPTVGEVAAHGLLTLTSADGTEFAAYDARPAGPADVGVVILPDVRGLHAYYEQLAIRFAEAGFAAVAIDYFGRTVGVGERSDTFDWQREIGSVKPEGVAADAGAAVAHLQSNGVRSVFTVGFCFGGSQSWRLAASELPLAGCIGFYGRPSMVADVEQSFHHPLLMLVAGADAATPMNDFLDFDRRLKALEKVHEMRVYDGAPHSFFDRSFGEWKDACTDAWQRILDFVQGHAAPTAATTR